MTSLAIAYPAIDPVLVSFGPIVIRWYALSYIAGLLLGWWYVRWMAARTPYAMRAEDVDDFLVWVTLAVVIGGRLGHVLFWGGDYYWNNPGAILRVWEGGMAFHGGILGVVIAGWIFVRRRGLSFLQVGDLMACAAPIGLFFGRVANFINGELWGRPSDLPWAMVFPRADSQPRHPSQLYEAFAEGLVLLVLLHLLWRRESVRLRPGMLTGVFVAGYGVARFLVEFVREPDVGYPLVGLTMGQLLSLPMVVLGVGLAVWAARREPVTPRRLDEGKDRSKTPPDRGRGRG